MATKKKAKASPNRSTAKNGGTRKSSKPTSTKEIVATKGAANKTAAKKNAARKSSAAKKVTAKKSTVSKSTVSKSPAKKIITKKSTAAGATKKSALKKSTAAGSTKKSHAKKSLGTKNSSARPVAGSMVGKTAPAFSLQNQDGATVTSKSLKGKPYVIYFYPKDNTPGCTTEACGFRDEFGPFQDHGVTLLGVSPDSVKSHGGFASKYELPFSLLSDPDKELASAYGVWALKKNYGREYMGIVRSTFLVGKNGKVLQEWRNVRVSGHVDAVIEEAKKA